MSRVTISVLGVLVGLMIWFDQSQTQAQSTIYFRENFEANAPRYGFAYLYPEESSWRLTHLPSGGWNGSGGAQVRMLAGRTQYNFGFSTPSLNRTFQMGDSVYFRWRIRFLPEMRVNQSWGNKFLLFGSTGVTPQSRFIMFMNPPHDSRGCTLGFNYPSQSWSYPNYYGLTASPNSFDTGMQSGSRLWNYAWSLAPHVNISWECGPPVFLTAPGSPFAYARPAAQGSAVPVDGWYHFQVYVKSGSGNAEFKVWTNNNSLSAPSSRVSGLTLGVTGWSEGAIIGGYMDNDTPSNDLGYVVDDFEVGSAFDPTWYPGGGTAPAPSPTAPSNLRVIR